MTRMHYVTTKWNCMCKMNWIAASEYNINEIFWFLPRFSLSSYRMHSVAKEFILSFQNGFCNYRMNCIAVEHIL